MVGQHHQLNGHEFELTPGDGEGQGSLAHCSQWGCKESETTQQLNNKRDSKQISSCQVRERERASTEGFQGNEINQYDTTTMGTYHYTFVQTH